MSDYAINIATVLEAKGVWADQADQLRGAAASIDEVQASAVGPRAAAALALFCDHWSDRLRSMQEQAQGNADALGEVVVLGLTVDSDKASDISGLLTHQPGATP
jgi:hypothetical protein